MTPEHPLPEEVEKAAGLKPCPFCGGKAKFDMIEDDERPTHAIICLNEDCRAVVSPRDCTQRQLVETWNRRSALAAKAGEGK
jgi:hypothetical protein